MTVNLACMVILTFQSMGIGSNACLESACRNRRIDAQSIP